ncbi:hypothetical protein CSKR_104542 [Clonorchis sinensis]|uniref:Uncharacterized protein n=1 Tax=Clonorchis sinensis TaxID=79923 RepID=A0A419Q5M0_CLOSI|nr:hypothetical protein CSKR_104542 [Clonorchis sinensis]
MGVLGKILSIIALGVGVFSSIGVIGTFGNSIKDVSSSSDKASVACAFIAMFIFAGTLIFVFVTLCCSCEKCLGIIVLAAGGAALFFSIIAYISFYDWSTHPSPMLSAPTKVPRPGEWLFGSMFASVAVLLTGCTLTCT